MFNEYRQARSESKQLIKHDYLTYTLILEENIKYNPLSFWSSVRKLRSTDGCVTTMALDGEEVEGSGDIAKAFATYFQSVYDSSTLTLDQLISGALSTPVSSDISCLTVTHISESEISRAINRLKSKRSCGPDGIPSFIFKGCSDFMIKPLHHLFNLSLSNSCFPVRWKLTKVVPVFKKGSKKEIANYRPVALLSTPAKIFESILYSRIFEHVKNYVTPYQHGFFPGKSINSNLLSFTNFCISSLDKGGQVDVIYTDFSKAFDKVNHLQLLQKLNHFGFSNDLVKFFSSYLHNRKQMVKYSDGFSDEFLVQSGVPQGSNLGPLLFLLFINDVVNCVQHSRVLLYADDMKIFHEINSIDDCDGLQSDLDRLVVWSQNNLQFNADKCVVVRYTRRTQRSVKFHYHIGNNFLSSKTQVKDLGVIFDEKFYFSHHIVESCKSAYRTLGFVCRSSNFIHNLNTFKLLYFSLVRSKLEFGFSIWYPHQYYLSQMIEQIQTKFLRFLYFKAFGIYTFLVSYSQLLSLFKMESLHKRRDLGMLVFLHKLLNGRIDCSELLSELGFLVPRPASRVRALFSPKFARTNLGAHAPVSVMMRLGNALPEHIDLFLSTFASYKELIRIYVPDLHSMPT